VDLVRPRSTPRGRVCVARHSAATRIGKTASHSNGSPPRETEVGTVQARPRFSLKHKWTRQGGCGIACRDHQPCWVLRTRATKNARGCAKCSRDLSQQRISDRECGPRPSAAGSSGDTRRRRSRRCSDRGEVLSRLEPSALCAGGDRACFCSRCARYTDTAHDRS
jgi:hypothetical protein